MNDQSEYTEADFEEFTRLVNMGDSRDQMDRINSRLKMRPFIERVGKDKCDAMFKRLCDE